MPNRRRNLLALAAIALALAGCSEPVGLRTVPAPPASVSVTGTITYRQRFALPPDAIVVVTLSDASRANAPAVTLAEQTIKVDGKEVPFPFSLTFDPAAVRPDGVYTVSARIEQQGRLLFANDIRYQVLTADLPDRVEVVVQPAR